MDPPAVTEEKVPNEKVEGAQVEAVASQVEGIEINLKDDILAKQAAIDEHALTLWSALQKYPKAVMWSILVSTAIIMEGYDIVLITSLLPSRPFCKDTEIMLPELTRTLSQRHGKPA
jgi:SP family general alpha glucoside:H+ symporter-like MFS transporter